jgi:GMP synthase-like glutamine amidotransferase
MKILIIQNCETESIGFFEDYLIDNKIEYSIFHAYNGSDFPNYIDFDAFIISGSPVSINDFEKYDYLIKENNFLQKTIEGKKQHLGICFGAQILAKILRANVRRNEVKEIGAYDVELTEDGKNSKLFDGFPAQFPVFQWHSDTFGIPDGAKLLVTGKDCINQAFSFENCLGIQFHLEVDSVETAKWADNYSNELIKFGKTKLQVVDQCRHIEMQMKEMVYKLMDNFLNYLLH